MKPILIAGLAALTMIFCPDFAYGQGFLKKLTESVGKEAKQVIENETERVAKDAISKGEKVLTGTKKSSTKSNNKKSTNTSTRTKSSTSTAKGYNLDPDIDPRLQCKMFPSKSEQEFYSDAYESWRRPFEEVLAEAGPDILWDSIKVDADKKGELWLEVDIPEDKNIEYCMSYQEMQEVQHVKFRGRLFKWGAYDRCGALYNFINRLPKVRSVNLRDLDCEEMTENMVDHGPGGAYYWFVFPYNCETTNLDVKSINVVYSKNLRVFGYITRGSNHTMTNGGLIDNFHTNTIMFPEGFEYIDMIRIHESTEKVYLPSTMWHLETIQLSNCVKEIHIRRSHPPYFFWLDKTKTVSKVEGRAEQFKHCTLYVPKGCRENYTSVAGWRNFYNIVEE